MLRHHILGRLGNRHKSLRHRFVYRGFWTAIPLYQCVLSQASSVAKNIFGIFLVENVLRLLLISIKGTKLRILVDTLRTGEPLASPRCYDSGQIEACTPMKMTLSKYVAYVGTKERLDFVQKLWNCCDGAGSCRLKERIFHLSNRQLNICYQKDNLSCNWPSWRIYYLISTLC